MEKGSLELIPSPGIPPLVIKIEDGESSSNVRDIAGAALRLALADRSPAPGIVEFLKEWVQMDSTKEFAEKKKLSDARKGNSEPQHAHKQ